MGSPTLGLRIGAVFILFFVSALGCMTPYLFIQVRKRRDRHRADKHQQQGQQQPQTPQHASDAANAAVQQIEQGTHGHAHGQDYQKLHKHHHHLEAFHTTRAMHLLKAFSAGIVLSVGFVHVLAEAQEKLSEVTEYPVGPFLSMIGCITVLALSQVVEGIVTSRRIARRQAALAARQESKNALAAEGTAASSAASTAGAGALGSGGIGSGVELASLPEGTSNGGSESGNNGNGGDAAGTAALLGLGQENQGPSGGNGVDKLKEHHRQLVEKLSLAKLATGAEGGEDSSQQAVQQMDEAALAVLEAGRLPLSEASSLNTPRNKSRSNSLTLFESPRNAGGLGLSGSGRNYHRSAAARRRDLMERRSSSFHLFHGHGGHNDAAHIVYSFQKESSLVIAYLMEIGIVFHSVLIGIGLGVIQSELAEVKTLLVAICVHQFFEGAGLATCILEAQLEKRKNFFMFSLFSVTTSFGVCLGIAMASVYDPDSKAAALLEGCFNAFASGLLIYLSLVDMMAEEFHSAMVKKDRVLQAQMFLMIFAGAGIMSLLAIWA